MSQSEYMQAVLLALSRRTAASERDEPNVVTRLFPITQIDAAARDLGFSGSVRDAVQYLLDRRYVQQSGTIDGGAIWITESGKTQTHPVQPLTPDKPEFNTVQPPTAPHQHICCGCRT